MQMRLLPWLLMLIVQPAAPGKAVIFVCEHGAAKSVIATAYFNRLTVERGLPTAGRPPTITQASRRVT